MKDYFKTLLGLFDAAIPVLLWCLAIYAMYWFFKTGSYWFFYEDMVMDTIREMVKPEHLKNYIGK